MIACNGDLEIELQSAELPKYRTEEIKSNPEIKCLEFTALASKFSRNLSKTKVPDVIAATVETAKNVPLQSGTPVADPCAGNTNAEVIPAIPTKINPTYEKYFALVFEITVPNKMAVKGAINHHGGEPIPPGFDRKAKLGPPPASAKPGSNKNLDGCKIASVVHGKLIKNGIANTNPRSFNRFSRRISSIRFHS